MSETPWEIRMLDTLHEMEQMEACFQIPWAGPPVADPHMCLAFRLVNAYCAGAFIGDEMVGATFGVMGQHEGELALHSHVTATQTKGVGYALKMHQREWARQQGIPHIYWTFDPLVRRNAVLNLEKLGGTVIRYLPNFYGAMEDALNRGDESDRMYVKWSTDPDTDREHNIHDKNFPALVKANGELQETDSIEPLLVYVPADVEGMRTEGSPDVAKWRMAVRTALHNRIESGWRIHSMWNREAYLVIPPGFEI